MRAANGTGLLNGAPLEAAVDAMRNALNRMDMAARS